MTGVQHHRAPNGIKLAMNAGLLASKFGFSQKAIHNYESGTRAIPSELLEQVVKQGNVALHTLLNVNPERPAIAERKRHAEFILDAFIELQKQMPHIDVPLLKNSVIHLAANWPNNTPATPDHF